MAPRSGQKSAFPTSPPYWCTDTHRHSMRVEFSQEEFILSWVTPNYRPDISRFPQLDQLVSVTKIERSKEEESIWKESAFHSFGAYGQVREAISPSDTAFPMIKLAHSSSTALELIRNEFAILKALSGQNLPVVQIAERALTRKSSIFGFQMEKLYPISLDDVPYHYGALEDAVYRIHKEGYVHADLTISNIMLDKRDNIRIIDFGHAGKHGELLPLDHPHRRYKDMEIFDVNVDKAALQTIRMTCNN